MRGRLRVAVVAVCSAAVGGAVVLLASLAGLLVQPSGGQKSADPSETRNDITLTVSYRAAGNGLVQIPVRLGDVSCSSSGDSSLATAASAEFGQALRVVGDGDRITALILRFDERAFLATAELSMKGERIEFSQLTGQINEWVERGPGAVITAEATLTGSVSCDREDH